MPPPPMLPLPFLRPTMTKTSLVSLDAGALRATRRTSQAAPSAPEKDQLRRRREEKETEETEETERQCDDMKVFMEDTEEGGGQGGCKITPEGENAHIVRGGDGLDC